MKEDMKEAVVKRLGNMRQKREGLAWIGNRKDHASRKFLLSQRVAEERAERTKVARQDGMDGNGFIPNRNLDILLSLWMGFKSMYL